MTGDLRAQVGARSLIVARPHRIVFGRRHQSQDARPIGESFMPIASADTVSRRWFSVEDVTMTSVLDGQHAGQALLVRAESTANAVRIWDGGDPVRLTPGGSYIAQGRVLFVGDLLDGKIWGARIEITSDRPEPPRRSLSGSGSTLRPTPLEIPPYTANVLQARYHRYYRHPPHFDPQPVPWAQVAVVLGLLVADQIGDRGVLRRALKEPQEAVSKLKHDVDRLFPGWLPASSETQKTFHDHLRTVLEMRGLFALTELHDFDRRFPLALDIIGSPGNT